jgi:hypothetical protein
MNRAVILVALGLAAAFGAGLWLGWRSSGSPSSKAASPVQVQATAAPTAATPTAAPATATARGTPACVDVRQAESLVGNAGCVTGLVVRVYPARSGNTFLDFCQDYRTCPFSSVIFASDKDKFGNLESLQGRRVEIRGDVVTYQNRAEIVIHDPQQVRSAP